MLITGSKLTASRMRSGWLALCAAGTLAVGGLAAGTLTATPASARVTAAHRCSGTSFTWTGLGDGSSWSDPKNWRPSGTPGSCGADSVDIPVEANITGAPAASLQNFTIDSTAGSDGSLTGGPLTVTGQFTWDGSSLETTINLPAGSTGTIGGPANGKGLGGGGLGIPGTLNVSGTLALRLAQRQVLQADRQPGLHRRLPRDGHGRRVRLASVRG